MNVGNDDNVNAFFLLLFLHTQVHCFTSSEWDSSVDYMFLRNTVPNEAKLSVKLTRSAEKCAYCCQCSSASEGGERELNAQLSTQGPQWVCAGH